MNEDFVSYDLAVRLKAAGFDWMCADYIKVIPGTEREEWDDEDCQWCTVQDIERYPKATLYLAQKWLREVKGLSVEPYANIAVAWNYNISDLDDFANHVGGGVTYPSYEQALSAGITAALELIEKGGSND